MELHTQIDASTLEKRLTRERLARTQAEDLLERKSLELYQSNASLTKAMHDSENSVMRMNAIINALSDCVVVTDKDLDIREANESSRRQLGIAPEDLVGLSLSHFISEPHIDIYTELCDIITEAKPDDFDPTGMEFDFTDANGAPITVEIGLRTFAHDDDLFLLHIIRDVSKRKTLELERQQMVADLAQAGKWEAVGQLAGGIAHEINTPAQYISDNLQFLNESAEQVLEILEKTLALKDLCTAANTHTDAIENINTLIETYDLEFLMEDMPEAFEQAISGIKEVSRIVLAMKEFSHPGSAEKQLIDINKTIDTALTVSRNQWKHVAELQTDFDPDLPNITGNPGELNQVLLNVLVNGAHAIEDTGKRGTITICTKPHESQDAVVIRITDTGGGIPAHVQENIFNPFFTTKAVGKGTGQGLSIARDIVNNRHGGDLSFETEEGIGTTFIICLPLRL